MCGIVWDGFRGVRFCSVWERLVWVWGSEFVPCVGEFVVGSGGVSLCCVWESLGRVLGSVIVLCVGQYGVGFGE